MHKKTNKKTTYKVWLKIIDKSSPCVFKLLAQVRVEKGTLVEKELPYKKWATCEELPHGEYSTNGLFDINHNDPNLSLEILYTD